MQRLRIDRRRDAVGLKQLAEIEPTKAVKALDRDLVSRVADRIAAGHVYRIVQPLLFFADFLEKVLPEIRAIFLLALPEQRGVNAVAEVRFNVRRKRVS